MGSWFNWKTAIGSIAFGLLFAVTLFIWTGQPFSLSGLDLFFALTTVISLGFNLWQLFRDRYKYSDEARKGDHKWWITNTEKFKRHYPGWDITISLQDIIREMVYHETSIEHIAAAS